MAYGGVNVPGVSVPTLNAAVDKLRAEIMSGTLTTHLLTQDGTPILTQDGEEILAVTYL